MSAWEDGGVRKLVVNESEAKTVRHIFTRFLEMGSVSLLAADLERSDIVSKPRIFESGKQLGGRLMGSGVLCGLLANRTYLGETTHKGRSYKGEHEAIIPKDLFASVRETAGGNAAHYKVKGPVGAGVTVQEPPSPIDKPNGVD